MDEKKMDELYDMVRENNHMLKSARRTAFLGGIVKAVWWVVILIVLPYLTWLYIEPYVNTAMAQYQAVQQQGVDLQNQAANFQKQLTDLQGQTGGFMDLLKRFGIGAQ